MIIGEKNRIVHLFDYNTMIDNKKYVPIKLPFAQETTRTIVINTHNLIVENDYFCNHLNVIEINQLTLKSVLHNKIQF